VHSIKAIHTGESD